MVGGHADPREVFREAEKHYGSLAADELPARRISPEPAQRGPRAPVVGAAARPPFPALGRGGARLRRPGQSNRYSAK